MSIRIFWGIHIFLFLLHCDFLMDISIILLAGAVLIGDGCVIEIDAEIETVFDDLSGLCLIHRPAMLSGGSLCQYIF